MTLKSALERTPVAAPRNSGSGEAPPPVRGKLAASKTSGGAKVAGGVSLWGNAKLSKKSASTGARAGKRPASSSTLLSSSVTQTKADADAATSSAAVADKVGCFEAAFTPRSLCFACYSC